MKKMNRHYNLNGVVLGVHYDDFFDDIEVFRFGEREDYDEYLHCEKLKEDADGRKYFHFNEMKIYFDDYIYTPFNQLIEQFNNGERCSGDEFINSILKIGINNVIVEYPVDCCDFVIGGVGISSGRTKMVKCRFVEGGQYEIMDNYKVTIEPIEPISDGKLLSKKTFYLSDFLSLMKAGKGKFFINNEEKENS